MKYSLILLSFLTANLAFAAVTVVTKIRCELDFDYDSSELPQEGLEECLSKITLTDHTPNHFSIFATSSPPGATEYNFKLSQKRAEAIVKEISQRFPKTEREVFPGGENPNFGQKAVLIASISSSDQVLISRQKIEPILEPDFLKATVGRTDFTVEDGEFSSFGIEYQREIDWRGYNLTWVGLVAKLNSSKYLDQTIMGSAVLFNTSLNRFQLGLGPLLQALYNNQSDLALDGGLRGSLSYSYRNWLGDLSLSRTRETTGFSIGIAKLI